MTDKRTKFDAMIAAGLSVADAAAASGFDLSDDEQPRAIHQRQHAAGVGVLALIVVAVWLVAKLL